MLFTFFYNLIIEGGKGGYRSRFTKNKSALSQFTKNNNGISRFTKKKVFSDITYRYILKSSIQSKALFEVFTIRPLRVRNPLDDFVDLVQLVFPPWWVTIMADQAGLAKGHRTPEHTTWSTQGSTLLSRPAILFLSSLRNDGCQK